MEGAGQGQAERQRGRSIGLGLLVDISRLVPVRSSTRDLHTFTTTTTTTTTRSPRLDGDREQGGMHGHTSLSGN